MTRNIPLPPILSIILRLQFVLLLTAITTLSLLPVQNTPLANVWDKALHFVAWCSLYISLQFAFQLRAPAVFSMLALLSYSFLIEIVQSQVGRSFSLLDLLANGIGISIGFLTILLIKMVVKKLGYC